MSELVTLEIPDSAYQWLSTLAKGSSQSVDTLAASLLSAAIANLGDNPLVKLAGVLRTGIPDLAAPFRSGSRNHLRRKRGARSASRGVLEL